LRNHQEHGEIATGLLYLDESMPEIHEMSQTSDRPMVDIPFEELCPGSSALEQLQEEYR
jgi:2-oxoglutarate ferredoxin oxidoreductase subunit beta